MKMEGMEWNKKMEFPNWISGVNLSTSAHLPQLPNVIRFAASLALPAMQLIDDPGGKSKTGPLPPGDFNQP